MWQSLESEIEGMAPYGIHHVAFNSLSPTPPSWRRVQALEIEGVAPIRTIRRPGTMASVGTMVAVPSAASLHLLRRVSLARAP
jgi:hypothetical protein